MGYWGWRPLINTLFICVLVSGCSLSSATTPIVSPTSLPPITLTLREREARAPTVTPVSPVTPTTAPETPAPAEFYVVRPGDTLLGIALDLGLNIEQLKAANPILDPLALQVGQQVTLPQQGIAIAAAATPLPLQLDPPTCFDLITGSLLCMGQVVNRYDQPVTGVRLRVRLRGLDGEALAETSTGIEQTIILPGQAAPYSAIFNTTGDVQPEVVVLHAVPATGQEALALEVVDQQTEFSGSRYHVSATITNTTGIATRPPRVVLTVVDSEGHLAAFRVMTGTTSMEPGARQFIEIDALPQSGTGNLTHHLYVEAYPS